MSAFMYVCKVQCANIYWEKGLYSSLDWVISQWDGWELWKKSAAVQKKTPSRITTHLFFLFSTYSILYSPAPPSYQSQPGRPHDWYSLLCCLTSSLKDWIVILKGSSMMCSIKTILGGIVHNFPLSKKKVSLINNKKTLFFGFDVE